MKKNNKFVCLLVTAMMILCLAACGKGTDTTKPSDTKQSTAQKSTQATDSSPANNSSSSSVVQSGEKMTVPAKLTGKINIIKSEDKKSPVLKGLRITGNRIGNEDDINGKKSSLDDVRCIFALNEWFEFYPDIDKEYGLRVWILEHRDDHDYYKTCKFSEEMPGYAGYCDVKYPSDSENPEEYSWGSFYLNPEDNKAGYYDFVFTYEGKAIATLLTRFYEEEKLNEKSGSELEAMMHE